MEVHAPSGTSRAQLLARGDQWLKKQPPMQWSCQIEEGEQAQSFNYHLGYGSHYPPDNDVAVMYVVQDKHLKIK